MESIIRRKEKPKAGKEKGLLYGKGDVRERKQFLEKGVALLCKPSLEDSLTVEGWYKLCLLL